jgi:glycerophosphoryl diester phosphodiesterase
VRKYLLPAFVLFISFCTLAIQAEDIVLPVFGISAHRGENGTFPENTIVGFQEAVKLGAAQVELDVCRTKDGYLVIMHDDTVDRTTDGKGKVSDLTFEEIRKLDAGIKKGKQFTDTKVPTLEESLDCLPRNIWINVHIKNSPLEAAKVIIEKNREHQAFLACGHKAALEVKEKYPQIKICNMERGSGNVSEYIRNTIEWQCDFLQLVNLGTPEEMKALKDAGVRINYFFAKHPEHYKELRKACVDFSLVDDMSKFVDAAKE